MGRGQGQVLHPQCAQRYVPSLLDSVHPVLGVTATTGGYAENVCPCGAGKTQRLRLLNGGGAWSFRVWIEDHPMQVIAVSGTDIEPIKVRPRKREAVDPDTGGRS